MEKSAKFQAGEILLAGCRTKSDRLLGLKIKSRNANIFIIFITN